MVANAKKEKIVNGDFRNKIFSRYSIFCSAYDNCTFFLADFSETRITGVFYKCDFTSANLDKAVLADARFIDCKFMSTYMRNCRLRSCKFIKCDLTAADLTGVVGATTCLFDAGCTFTSVRGVSPVKQLNGDFNIYRKFGQEPANTSATRATSPKPVPVKPAPKSNNTLVDPVSLPEVDHYRSPPVQVPKWALEDDDDPYNYMYNHYTYYAGDYGWGDTEHKEKWGYKENAVLECADIEEFRGCIRGAL